jgi:hypothetical protein
VVYSLTFYGRVTKEDVFVIFSVVLKNETYHRLQISSALWRGSSQMRRPECSACS